MTILTHTGPTFAGYIVSEHIYRSRDAAVVAAGAAALLAGTILGRLTASVSATAAKAGNTGNATVGTVTITAAARVGVYEIIFLTATTFRVVNPDDIEVGTGSTGVVFTGGGLSFTVTAGGTPMIADDGFDITVTEVIGNYVQHVIGETDGSQTVAGILYEELALNAVEERAITVRESEVNGHHLVYPTGATAAQIATIDAALLALGIVVRR